MAYGDFLLISSIVVPLWRVILVGVETGTFLLRICTVYLVWVAENEVRSFAVLLFQWSRAVSVKTPPVTGTTGAVRVV